MEIDSTHLWVVKNDTNEPMRLWKSSSRPRTLEKKLYDETLLEPNHVRIYEFLHGYEDITIDEYEQWNNDPRHKIFVEELQKEIGCFLIGTICDKAKNG